MLDDLLGSMGSTTPVVQKTYQPSLYSAYEDSNLSIGFSIKRDAADPTSFLVRAYYQNKTGMVLS